LLIVGIFPIGNDTMKMIANCLVTVFASLAWFGIAGCTSPTTPAPSAQQADANEADHHEGDDHEALGPNGGHVLAFADRQFHAEWTHDDKSHEIVVYLLDGDLKEPVYADAESTTIVVAIQKQGSKDYRLEAIDPTDGEPRTASKFHVTDSGLLTALKIGEGVYANLSVVIDGQQHSTRIEHHTHDHGHHHH
jgi:hypothetical protein